jgi:hypothetical protein
MSLRVLRAEVWARDDVKKLNRVAIRTLPDGQLEGPAVAIVSRLVIDAVFHALRTRFQKHADAILVAVGARAKDRLKILANTIETRKQREIGDMMQLLDDLARNLEAELRKDEEPKQYSLFSEDERTQLRRDRLALEVRLRRIPEERERERLGIEERHSDLVDHTFPVAVIMLIPESLIARRQS